MNKVVEENGCGEGKYNSKSYLLQVETAAFLYLCFISITSLVLSNFDLNIGTSKERLVVDSLFH